MRRGRAILVVGVALALGSGAAVSLAWRARQPFWLELGREGEIDSLVFDSSGQWLAGANADGVTALWSVDRRSRVALDQGSALARNAIAFSLAGELVALTRANDLVARRVPDLATVRRVPVGPRGRLQPAAIREDLAATLALDARRAHLPLRSRKRAFAHDVVLWSVSGEPRERRRWTFGGTVRWLGFVHQGKRLVLDDGHRKLSVLDVESGQRVAEVDAPGVLPRALSPVGDVIAACGSHSLQVDLRSFQGRALRSFALEEPPLGTGDGPFVQGISELAFSPDGTLLAALAYSKPPDLDDGFAWLELWDTESGRRLRTLRLPASASELAFSPAGDLLAVACGSRVLVLHP